MATPSQAEIETYWKAAVDCLEDARSNADGTLVGNIDTVQQAAKGDYIASLGAQAVDAWRLALAGVVTREIAAAMLTPVMLEYGKFVGSPGAARGDVRRCLADVYRYWHANTRTVKSRNGTFGAASAGSNTGDGTWSRLTVDENGYQLGAWTPEVKTARCVRDGNTGGRRHAEEWILYGKSASRDALAASSHGSGLQRTVYSRHAGDGDGGSLLLNGAFSDYNASGSTTTKYPGWTITTSASNVAVQTSTVYRGFPGSDENTTGGPTARSVEITADDGITQRLTVKGTSLVPDVPYFLRVMLMRKSSATGTVTLAFGAQTATQALGSLTNNVWAELPLTIGTKCWPINAYESNLDIGISVASLATGTFYVGDIILSPWDYLDGTYYMLRGGATAWKQNDSHTFTDTGGAAADAKLQYWLQWAFPDFYLPSTTGTPTVADP